MVTTVTDNSPQAINTSLFSLEKDTDGKVLLLNNKIKEANDAIAAINKILDGINKDAGVVSVNGKQGIVTLDASDVGALPDTTTIPSKTSQLTNDSGFITSSSLSSYVPTSRTVNNKALSNNISLTASDVGALPSDTHIPTDPVQSNWTETDTSSLAYIENKPNLATVATSGSYNDLSNKPTIPTATSQLTNDSDFATTTEVSSTVNSFVPEILGIQNSNDPDNFPVDGVRVYRVRQYNIGWASNDGLIINIPWSDKFGFQIAVDDQSNWMAVRSKANGTWLAWQRVQLVS